MDPRLESYLAMLFHWNATVRLTAFGSAAEALRLGVEPSRLALPRLPAGAKVLDIGSGGGFPAVVLAMERPDVELLLCEPSVPKAVFLREVAIKMGLRYAVETTPVEPFLRSGAGPWDAITVRGLKLTKGLVKRLAKSLRNGGVLLVWTAGERARQYGEWMRDQGLEVESSPVPGAPLVFMAGRVPRGT